MIRLTNIDTEFNVKMCCTDEFGIIDVIDYQKDYRLQ
jgi:hypothetical protein